MVLNAVFSNQYLNIANILLFLSFLQRNQLMFRLIIISSTVFYLTQCFIYDIVFIDTVTFQICFIVINSYSAFQIFSNIIPPELDKEGLYVYQNVFSKYFSKSQYNYIYQICKRRVYRVNSPIALTGNGFISVFLVVTKPDEATIQLKFQDSVIGTLNELSWIGLVEYVNMINKGDFETNLDLRNTGMWEIDSLIKYENTTNKSKFEIKNLSLSFTREEFIAEINNNINNNDDLNSSKTDTDESESFLDEENINSKKEVVIYEWNLVDLQQLYKSSKEIKNSLHSIWLVYMAKYLTQNNSIEDVNNRKTGNLYK